MSDDRMVNLRDNFREELERMQTPAHSHQTTLTLDGTKFAMAVQDAAADTSLVVMTDDLIEPFYLGPDQARLLAATLFWLADRADDKD